MNLLIITVITTVCLIFEKTVVYGDADVCEATSKDKPK